MSFGRNPYVTKAETAEQKARTARDELAREQAWRDAARQWERAADRESDDKRRAQYTERAQAARHSAEQTDVVEREQESSEDAPLDDALPDLPTGAPRKRTLLN